MARPKGTPNKIGRLVMDNVLTVFRQIGGVDGMVKWARRNRTEFYQLYARLIPKDTTLTVNVRDVTELTDAELALIATGRGAGVTGEESGESESYEFH